MKVQSKWLTGKQQNPLYIWLYLFFYDIFWVKIIYNLRKQILLKLYRYSNYFCDKLVYKSKNSSKIDGISD